MIRVALAALLAVALLGVATPAIDDARTSATERVLRADLSRVGAAAESLAARHDAVGPKSGPARRTVQLVVPGRGWDRAPATVTVGTDAGNESFEGGSLEWRVGGGTLRSIRIGIDLRVWRDGRPAAGELRLGPGRHRLVLSLVRADGRPVVAVRGFKSDTGRISSRVRARVRRGGDGGAERVRVRADSRGRYPRGVS